MRLSILGPPGAGKSTQAKSLSAACNLAHIYAGELLRHEADSDSPFAERIRSHLESGSLVPSDIVLYLMERELARSGGRYILDGFPRNIEQAVELEFLLRERSETLDSVIFLSISDEEVFRRLLARGRPDDTPDIIRHRIRMFHAETDSVIRFYSEKGVLVDISGAGSVIEVTDRILAAVQAKITSLNTARCRPGV